MTRLIVGADPGTELTGMVAVTPATSGRVALVKREMVPSTPSAFLEFLRGLPMKPDAVAVERAEGGGFDNYRVKPLLKAQWSGGELGGIAFALGCTVLRASASVWRKAVIGNLKRGQSYDALIECALRAYCVDFDAKNTDVNDATGIAYWASMKLWRRAA